MDEATVHKYVKEFFRSKKYGVPEIRINLAGMWPDVVAYDEAIVITVEAKDNASRVPEALGQAIVYQLGSNRVYVAVPEGVAEKHKRILSHLGLGLLEVKDDGTVTESLPAMHSEIIDEDILKDVRKQISVRLGERSIIPWWSTPKAVRDVTALALQGIIDISGITNQLNSIYKKPRHPDTILGYALDAAGYGLLDVDSKDKKVLPTGLAEKVLQPVISRIGSPLSKDEKDIFKALIWNFILTKPVYDFIKDKGEATLKEVESQVVKHPSWLGWKPFNINVLLRHMVLLDILEKTKRKYRIK